MEEYIKRAKRFEEVINNLKMPAENEDFYIFYSLRKTTPIQLLKQFNRKLSTIELIEKYDIHFGRDMTKEDWNDLIEHKPSTLLYNFCLVENYDVGLGLISFEDKLGKEPFLEDQRKKLLNQEENEDDDEWYNIY